jgi:hypothetical protein
MMAVGMRRLRIIYRTIITRKIGKISWCSVQMNIKLDQKKRQVDKTCQYFRKNIIYMLKHPALMACLQR